MRLYSIIITLILSSYMIIKNPVKPLMPNNSEGHFLIVKDNSRIFIYDYKPVQEYEATIFIISGITGINHNNEKDIIKQLGNNKYRVVVIHPRGSHSR